MNNYFKIFFAYIIIFFAPVWNSYSQTISTDNDFILQNYIFSLNGGMAYGFSDYKNSSIGPAIRGSFEYFPIIIQSARLGFKVFAGGLVLNFEDPRNSASSNDGPRVILNEVSTDVIQFGAGLSFGYALSELILPTITAGATYLSFSPKNSVGNRMPFNAQEYYDKGIFFFTIEGELKIKLSEKLSVSTLVSYYPTSTDYLEDFSASTNNDNYITGMIGLSYALSGSPDSDNDGVPDITDQCPNTPKDVIVDEFGCPLDIDNDGVPDYIDQCSDTPRTGVAVDSTGCPKDSDQDGVTDHLDKCSDTPANIDVDSFGCPSDSDKDGVPDYLDKCLNTPFGVTVDSVGCPLDNDKDGIPDHLDKCPDTPANSKVDSSGCPDKDVETLYQFNLRGDDTFINGSSNLKEVAKLILNEIAFYIQNQLNSKWRIEGHMDSQGAAYSIKKLSYDRAKAVFDYLVFQGVAVGNLEIHALGDSFPIGNNNTAEGRSANRRIMIIREN